MDELKTLIFRTDRIGDFIISCPFILSYKNRYEDDKIIIISSEYNYNYIKNFKFVNKIFPLKNETKFLKKILVLIKMIFTLRKHKFSNIIVLDGKKRSFFISLFLHGKKSILLQSKGLEFLSRIFNYNSVINYELQNQLKNFSFLASRLNFNIKLKELNIYENYDFKKILDFKKKYINIHLDEKWFTKYYYNDFTDINPNLEEFSFFIKKLTNILSSNYDVVITSGSKELDILKQYTRDFEKINNYTYSKQHNNTKVFFLDNIFLDLLAVLLSISLKE